MLHKVSAIFLSFCNSRECASHCIVWIANSFMHDDDIARCKVKRNHIFYPQLHTHFDSHTQIDAHQVTENAGFSTHFHIYCETLDDKCTLSNDASRIIVQSSSQFINWKTWNVHPHQRKLRSCPDGSMQNGISDSRTRRRSYHSSVCVRMHACAKGTL